MARVHRTRTTAALLATVAVTTVAGCVTVDRPPGPGSPTGRSPAATSTTAGEHAEPQIERDPARESLRRVGEEPTGTATRPPRPRPTKAAPPPRPAAPALPAPVRPDPAPTPVAPPLPRARPPAAPDPAIPGVCALGRQYGKWPPGSPQSRICEDAYGG
ncbi:hypothetical protein D0C37_29545 [Streptomyces koyangensis]|uniref:Lipoprotein n=1 Tax=Streptomyces koyangensis TaxID=188770 RepID=A0A385DKN4_9ACTN|nr:hypothetical protein D0C37_29545 [Streptomyces koyangensis]